MLNHRPLLVMAGLVPAIQPWMPGTSPGMTTEDARLYARAYSLWRLICGRNTASRPIAGRKAQT